MKNKIILLYWLRCCWRLKSYQKKWQQKHFSRFSLYLYYLKKVREEKGGGGGGYPSVALYSSLRTRKKYQATRKISARIIFQTIEKCACMDMMKPVTW